MWIIWIITAKIQVYVWEWSRFGRPQALSSFSHLESDSSLLIGLPHSTLFTLCSWLSTQQPVKHKLLSYSVQHHQNTAWNPDHGQRGPAPFCSSYIDLFVIGPHPCNMGSNHRVSAPAVASAWNAFSKEFQMAGLSLHVGVQMSLLEALLFPHLRITFTHPSTLSMKLTHSISHLLFTTWGHCLFPPFPLGNKSTESKDFNLDPGYQN